MFCIAPKAQLNRRPQPLRKNYVSILIFAAATALTVSGCAQKPPERPEAAPGKIQWIYDLDAGLARAGKENKPVMIDFVADWCAPCKEMNDSTFSNADVVRKMQAFIPVRIDIDKQHAVAERYNALARAYGGSGIPNILFLSGKRMKLKQVIGYQTAGQIISAMNSALKQLEINLAKERR